VTDYIPNDPDCPKCLGLGVDLASRIPSVWRDCHCQHPKLAAKSRERDLRKLAEVRHGIVALESGAIVMSIRHEATHLPDTQFAPAVPPQPITFRDENGREWSLRAEQSEHEDGGCLIRDATPDDLSRAGYSERFAEELKSKVADLSERALRRQEAEIEALRALAEHVRAYGSLDRWEAYCEVTQALLKAIDEAREGKV
jgi:hypothetical protein